MTERARLLAFFKGNESAADLAFAIALVADVWDDLYDRDKGVSNDRINKAFWAALFEIPSNPIYREFEDLIRPTMVSGYLAWMGANALQQEVKNHHALTVAHVTRYSLADSLTMIAFAIGGREWAESQAMDIRLFCQRETLAEFLKEVGHAES